MVVRRIAARVAVRALRDDRVDSNSVPCLVERLAPFLLALTLASGCSIDRTALFPGGPGPADATADMGSPDGDPPTDSSTPTDGTTLDADSTVVADSAPVDSSVVVDSSTVPDADATIDTSGPPDCATLFAGATGFTSVCRGSTTSCVLEIDVDPDRTTCASVCAEAGWICETASGAASTTPRCDEAPIGRCDQNLRIQVCVCTAP
jgi:hypothetical protein